MILNIIGTPEHQGRRHQFDDRFELEAAADGSGHDAGDADAQGKRGQDDKRTGLLRIIRGAQADDTADQGKHA